jgi:hypothetical protein
MKFYLLPALDKNDMSRNDFYKDGTIVNIKSASGILNVGNKKVRLTLFERYLKFCDFIMN